MTSIKFCIKDQNLFSTLEIHEQRKVKSLLTSILEHLTQSYQSDHAANSIIQPVGSVWIYAFVSNNITHYGIAESRLDANSNINSSQLDPEGSITRIGRLN